MAIYHCSLKVFSRSEDACAIAKAAYRSGSNITNERTGYTHRYANKAGVRETFLLYPASAEDFFSVKTQQTHSVHTKRAVLWNAAEASETRKNSRVARELVLALPHELSRKGQAQLTRDMAAWLIENYRVAVDCAIHDPVNGDDARNVHAHLMFTTRELNAAGMGKKTRILDDKVSGPAQTEIIREVWETLANDALRSEGFDDIQIDRRSYEDQGIDAIPQTHIGPQAGQASHAAEAKDQAKSGSRSKDESDGDDEKDGKSSSSSGGGTGGQGPAATNKDERKAKSDDDDSDEEGKQGSGSASSGDAVALKLTSKLKRDGNRTIDYPKIDRGSRRDFVDQIKALNAKREQLPDKPIKDQITEVHQLIEKLDHRVTRLKELEQGTSFPALIRQALTKALEFTARLVLQCFNQSEQLKADEQGRALKQERQQQRYGKAYRAGLHTRIERLTREIETLQKLERQYQAFDRFIGKLEAEIKRLRIENTHSVFKNSAHSSMQVSNPPPSMSIEAQKAKGDITGIEKKAGRGPQQPRLSRTVSITELRLKMQAKAAMVREQVPQHFQPELKVKSQEQYPAARSLLAQHNPIIYETARTQNRPLENTYKKPVSAMLRAFQKAHMPEPVREVKPILEVAKQPGWQKQIEGKIAQTPKREPARAESVKIHRGKTMYQERRQAHREKVEVARSIVPDKYKPEVIATPETKQPKGRVVFKDLEDVRQRRTRDVKGTSLKAKFTASRPPREEPPTLDVEAYKKARYERSKDVRADVPPQYRAEPYEAPEALEKPSGMKGEFSSSDRPEAGRRKMSDGFNKTSPPDSEGLDDELGSDLEL